MKRKFFILALLFALLSLASCETDDFDVKNPNVDQFVIVLKKGNYFSEVGYQLPDFNDKHIGNLLDYVNDTSIVNEFPTNPVSSKYTALKILSECIMWTIDGIRLGNKYPSLEPCLVDTTTYSELHGYARMSGQELLKISKLYINWYNEYKQNPTTELLKKNLFENTPYRWN